MKGVLQLNDRSNNKLSRLCVTAEGETEYTNRPHQKNAKKKGKNLLLTGNKKN